MAKIRNRLFGNNNLVHSTENSASVGTMLSYVGPISVSAFFRISRWTTRDQIATRLSELREKEREATSIFSSEERRPANSLPRPLLPYAQCAWYFVWCSMQECYESNFTIVIASYRSLQTRSDNGSLRETQGIVLAILISLKEIPRIFDIAKRTKTEENFSQIIIRAQLKMQHRSRFFIN